MGLTLTSIVEAEPRRNYSFSDHSTYQPSAPQPGDRLDAEFDHIYTILADIAASLSTITAPRPVALTDLAPGVLDALSQAALQKAQLALLQIQGAAANALAQADRANSEATRAAAASAEARASSTQVAEAGAGVQTALLTIDSRLTDAETDAINTQNAANDAEDAANRARQDQELAGAWAEYLQGGNPIPPDFFAGTAVTGNHWSARWWAAEAAGAFGSLASLYCGATSTPPGSTLTGHPLPVGAIYYDTISQQPYVWDGDSWNAFYAPVKSTQLTLLYRATAGQTAFPLATNDLNGQHFTLNTVTPEPVDAYVNGVRLPRDAPVTGDGNGDWDVNPATNTLTFLTPLAAGSLVQIDVLSNVTPGGIAEAPTNSIAYGRLNAGWTGVLQLTGGTLLGPLVLAGDGTAPLNPVTRQQLDGKLSLSGGTLTGLLTLSGAPTSSLHAATKAYTDAGDTAARSYADTGDATRLPLAGGTLTGALTLSGAPTQSLHAATKAYTDAGDASRLPLSGGTLTGALTLAGAPTSALHAATKQYVDTAVSAYLPLTGGTLTGVLSAPGLSSSSSISMLQASGNSYWGADANYVYFLFGGNWGWAWARATGNLSYLNSSGSPLLTVAATGIGLMYPMIDTTAYHAVAWNNATSDLLAYLNGSSLGNLVYSQFVSGAQFNVRSLGMNVNGSMYAYTGGGIFTWSAAASDRRLKSNIVPSIYDALAAINALPVYSCDYTPGPGMAPQHWDCAVMADEVETIVPSAYLAPVSEDTYASVKELPMIATLIRAVQQLTARVAVLEGAP